MFSILRKSALIILIVSVYISFHYGSTNPKHVFIRCLHSILTFTFNFLPDSNRPHLSADYRAFEMLLRHRSSINLHSSIDSIFSAEKLRSSFSLDFILPKPSSCRIKKKSLIVDNENINTYWINNLQFDREPDENKLLIYLHGGAYISGDIHHYSGFECHLSYLFNLTVIHLEYRRAPEYPLPLAVDDSVALYNEILYDRKTSPSQIILMGDSAGGGLSLLTIQRLISNRIPIPRGVIVLSPWTDLTLSSESYRRSRSTDVMLKFEALTWSAQHAIGKNEKQRDPKNPMFSPLFGSFSGFPPMYVNVGTAELLEDDSRQVVEKARQVGVNVTFEEGRDLAHVYPLFFPYFPESRMSLENIRKWIENQYQQ